MSDDLDRRGGVGRRARGRRRGLAGEGVQTLLELVDSLRGDRLFSLSGGTALGGASGAACDLSEGGRSAG